jgi:hypothetical protein
MLSQVFFFLQKSTDILMLGWVNSAASTENFLFCNNIVVGDVSLSFLVAWWFHGLRT